MTWRDCLITSLKKPLPALVGLIYVVGLACAAGEPDRPFSVVWRQPPQSSGTGQDLWRVHFSDPGTGWVVGDSGTILVTRDGGERWQLQTTTTLNHLRGVHFTDPRTGWAVGVNGTILVTHDGGEHWQPQAAGNNKNLWGVHFADPRTGWVVGANGTILVTRDSGENWQLQPSGTSNHLRGVHFFDVRTGWAVGWRGTVLGTRDGGAHWESQSNVTNRNLWGLHFADRRTGCAVGAGGTILVTHDGGEHWKLQPSGTDKNLWGVHLASAQTGWAVGDDGTILATRDGGEHWKPQAGRSDRILWGVHFADPHTGWAVGQDGALFHANPPITAPWVDEVEAKDDLTGGIELSFVVRHTPDLPSLGAFVEYKIGQRDWESLGVSKGPSEDGRWHLGWSPATHGLATNQSIEYRVHLDDGGPPLAPFNLGRFVYLPWWTTVKGHVASWISSNPQWAIPGLAFILWTLFCLILFRFWPIFAMRLSEALAPLDYKLPRFLGGTTVPLRHVLVIGFLGHRRRVLDAWVDSQTATARQRFAMKDTVKEREIHISLPATLDGDVIAELSGKSFAPTFSRQLACLLIWGEGGSGKSSLACHIAGRAMAQERNERLAKHRMLPILIEQEVNPLVIKGDEGRKGGKSAKRGKSVKPGKEVRNALFEVIRRQLQDLVDVPDPVPPLRLAALLRHRRVLVIVDGLSELSEATRARIDPSAADFPVNALVVTSRLKERLGEVTRTFLQPLRIEGNRLSRFMDAYLAQKAKRDAFNDAEFFEACKQLSLMVGDREVTVLLAKLYAEQIIAAKEGGRDDDIPANIPDLLLTYINHLNRKVSESKLDDHVLHEDAKLIAWKCVENSFASAATSRAEILGALRGSDSAVRLKYFQDRLNLIRAVEPAHVRFLLDPLAEYLAGLHVVESCGKSASAWRKFLSQADDLQNTSVSIGGFLLAVRDCCIVRRTAMEVPEFVEQELTRRAGFEPEALEKARHKRRVARHISDLKSTDPVNR
jgi:photosystem II stability/assembly factor-like uncharacterized protein/HEAT repeat protein